MIEVDGSLYSGSGMIVRQAVGLAALLGVELHISNVRAKREPPGLRMQHAKAVHAIAELAGGMVEGAEPGSRALHFSPGRPAAQASFSWDIGSAGSATMLALAILPVLAFRQAPVYAEVRGGLFQDFAPSYFHLRHVMLPLLSKMGITAEIEMVRPGYVPTGGGVLGMIVQPVRGCVTPVVLEQAGPVQRVWGIALASHLEERQVAHRMAATASEALSHAGYSAEIQTQDEQTAQQRGAALAVFADLEGGARLGADRAGALRRSAEAVGRYVAARLIEDVQSGATLDRHAADQVILFAALANGQSRFRIPDITDHMETAAWLAHLFLGARVRLDSHDLIIDGCGFVRSTP